MKVTPFAISVVVVCTLGVLATIFLFWPQSPVKPRPQTEVPAVSTSTPTPASTEAEATTGTPSLGGSIYEKTQNPAAGTIPQTNPFAARETNPIREVYKNPFE